MCNTKTIYLQTSQHLQKKSNVIILLFPTMQVSRNVHLQSKNVLRFYTDVDTRSFKGDSKGRRAVLTNFRVLNWCKNELHSMIKTMNTSIQLISNEGPFRENLVFPSPVSLKLTQKGKLLYQSLLIRLGKLWQRSLKHKMVMYTKH